MNLTVRMSARRLGEIAVGVQFFFDLAWRPSPYRSTDGGSVTECRRGTEVPDSKQDVICYHKKQRVHVCCCKAIEYGLVMYLGRLTSMPRGVVFRNEPQQR